MSQIQQVPEQIKRVIKEVSEYFNQDYLIVMSRRRFKELVKVRAFSMYFIVNQGHTLKFAASIFGLDHSTASVALSKLEEEVKVNRLLRNQFFELKDNVEAIYLKEEEDELDVEAGDILSDVYGKHKKEIIIQTIEE
jgi:chromosomal replication initiation ATPase DnaA